MVDGTTAVCWSPMLTDVLDAPVSELSVSDDVDTMENFVDTRALLYDVSR